MRITQDFVAVRVPATSANLGPGFDSFGLALDLWDEVSVHATAGATHVTIEGEGAGVLDEGENHLVVRALRMGLDAAGVAQVGIQMRCMNRIPHSRGLGSSASAIVAGLGLARALIGDPEALTAEDILAIATEMEGHPDNVAPAISGGVTISWMDGELPGMLRLSGRRQLSPLPLSLILSWRPRKHVLCFHSRSPSMMQNLIFRVLEFWLQSSVGKTM